MQRYLVNNVVVVIAAALCMLATPSLADWNPNNPVDQAKAKWVQLPDLTTTGLDVLDTLQPPGAVPSQWKTLADDFLCTQSGAVTDAHIWGSWLNDQVPINSQGLPDPGAIQFHIQFWTDVPAGPAPSFSHPGSLLWTGSFGPGQFQWNNFATANEGFFDPNLGQVIGGDTHVFQYNFPDLRSALGTYFTQTAGTIYWFEVQANVLNQQVGVVPATFGWKTADPNLPPRTYFPNQTYSFMDDAVFADTAGFADPNVNLPWRDLHYPPGHPYAPASMNLSFVLTVPEPSSIAMAGLGLVALVGTACRRASKSRRS